MAGLTRYTQTVFANSATAGQVKIFGSLAAGNPTTASDPGTDSTGVQYLSNWLSGWFSAVVGNNAFAIEDLNAALYQVTYQLAYILERGIPQYDAGTTYYQYDIVQYGGVIYQAIYSSGGFSSQQPPNATYWRNYTSVLNIRTVTGATDTATINDDVVRMNYAGSMTETLPAISATPIGKTITIKNVVNFVVTIHGNSSVPDLIDGSNTYVLQNQYDSVTLLCNGTSWDVI